MSIQRLQTLDCGIIKGKLVDSDRRKFGVIMGDNVRTGVNSMINAGATIRVHSVIYPGEFVKSIADL